MLFLLPWPRGVPSRLPAALGQDTGWGAEVPWGKEISGPAGRVHGPQDRPFPGSWPQTRAHWPGEGQGAPRRLGPALAQIRHLCFCPGMQTAEVSWRPRLRMREPPGEFRPLAQRCRVPGGVGPGLVFPDSQTAMSSRDDPGHRCNWNPVFLDNYKKALGGGKVIPALSTTLSFKSQSGQRGRALRQAPWWEAEAGDGKEPSLGN